MDNANVCLALTFQFKGEADKVRSFSQSLWSLLRYHTDFNVVLGGPETGRAITLRHHDPDKLRFLFHTIQSLTEASELKIGYLPVVSEH